MVAEGKFIEKFEAMEQGFGELLRSCADLEGQSRLDMARSLGELAGALTLVRSNALRLVEGSDLGIELSDDGSSNDTISPSDSATTTASHSQQDSLAGSSYISGELQNDIPAEQTEASTKFESAIEKYKGIEMPGRQIINIDQTVLQRYNDRSEQEPDRRLIQIVDDTTLLVNQNEIAHRVPYRLPRDGSPTAALQVLNLLLTDTVSPDGTGLTINEIVHILDWQGDRNTISQVLNRLKNSRLIFSQTDADGRTLRFSIYHDAMIVDDRADSNDSQHDEAKTDTNDPNDSIMLTEWGLRLVDNGDGRSLQIGDKEVKLREVTRDTLVKIIENEKSILFQDLHDLMMEQRGDISSELLQGALHEIRNLFEDHGVGDQWYDKTIMRDGLPERIIAVKGRKFNLEIPDFLDRSQRIAS